MIITSGGVAVLILGPPDPITKGIAICAIVVGSGLVVYDFYELNRLRNSLPDYAASLPSNRGDMDGDGTPDAFDPCPTDLSNAGDYQPDDWDNDGIPNEMDSDMDGDGSPNGIDPDPANPNVYDPDAPNRRQRRGCRL